MQSTPEPPTFDGPAPTTLRPAATAVVRTGAALALTLLVALAPTPAPTAEYHVDASTGADTNNGLSWTSSLATVGQALTLADATPEADTVRVAAGTYRENLRVPSQVVLEGGYPSGGGTRDPRANRTTLEGDFSDSVVTIGPDALGVVLDGFHITRGSDLFGGGVYAERSQVTLRGNVIFGNESPENLGRGGGIALEGPTPGSTGSVIEDNEIYDNMAADGNGGGIALLEFQAPAGPAARLSRNVIRGNRAEGSTDRLGRGGGVYILGNDALLEDNRILDNTAQGNRNQSGNGGGILILDADAVVTRNLIRGNTARGMGGGYSGSGGGLYANAFSGEISDNRILSNRGEGGDGQASAFGGGIFVFDGTPSITGNRIQGNALEANGCSSARGGGAYLSEAPALFAGNRVSDNANYTVGEEGDGPCWDDPDTCRCFIGGGLWSFQSADGLILESNRFESNVAGDGGGLTLGGSVASTLRHNRIRGNRAEEFLGAGMEVFFGDPTLFNNEIVRNVGDGLVLIGSDTDPAAATLRNVTIAENGLGCPGANPFCGIGLFTFYANGLDVRNSIVYGNGLSDWIDQPDANNDPTSPQNTWAYTDFGDRILPGDGNFAADPLFVRGPQGSFYLSTLDTGQGAASPCLDAGLDLAVDLNLDVLTTRTDDANDTGAVDLGFHYEKVDPTGEGLLWRVRRAGRGLDLSFVPVAGADAHRIYRGTLDSLGQGAYSHMSPFTTGQEECSLAAPASFFLVPGALDEPGSFYYLVVGLTGGTEGSFGDQDTDGDGIPDQERVRPEDDAGDLVVNNCP